jgi:tetratricopeptide (TPR) repeat protein
LASEPQGLISFGDFLLGQKRYKEALLEYQRALYLEPSLKSGIAIERMFQSGILAKDFHYVIGMAADDRFFGGGTQFGCQRSFFRARALYGLDNFTAAGEMFSALPNCQEATWQDRGHYFNGLAQLRQGRWEIASQSFGRVSPESDLSQRASRATSLSLEGSALNLKSPTKAIVFGAIVPGAGYAYADLPQTALAAFVTNAVFIWATVASAHRNEPALATVAGLFSFGWYFGSIHGSAQATKRRNERVRNNFIGQFELE